MAEQDEIYREIARALEHVYGRVDLDIDGFVVSYRKVICRNSIVIITYVDGSCLGKWLDPAGKHPESRFMRPRFSSLFSGRLHAKLLRALPKAKAMEMTRPKLISYDPFWGHERTLISHLKKNFKEIRLHEPAKEKEAPQHELEHIPV